MPEALRQFDANKKVTLLELLRFNAELFVAISKILQDRAIGQYADDLQSRQNAVSPETLAELTTLLAGVKNLVSNARLTVCVKHAEELLELVRQGHHPSYGDLTSLHENIERELSCQVFVAIPFNRQEQFSSIAGWKEIVARFPDSQQDIEEMNKCFALCRYSAAVFHSLIVAEHGLVELGNRLGVSDPKQGWDATCKKLEAVVRDGHAKNTSGLEFSFLEQANVCIQAMKHAWRNKVNHATGRPAVMTGGFAEYIAEEIISATRSLMRRLADGLPVKAVGG